jgi:phosphate transport system permease protein
VFVADARGLAHRYSVRGDGQPVLAESVRVLPEGVELTAFEFLFGSGTLLVGGGDGSLTPYYFLRKDGAGSVDGMTLVGLPPLQATGPAPVFLAPSRRDKSFAVADAAGAVRLLHGTSRKTLLEFSPTAAGKAAAVALAPRMDGLLSLDREGAGRFVEFSVPHPETTWRTLFGKVWYEGYPEPTFTWQSTGGTDEFEPKLSLVPLIFGTVKATVYSLLFAAPLAILAAIFTSEFMHHRVRGVVKPMMEMMASLPSVVLGFVAALVLAPVVEQWIAAVLLAFVGLPLALVSAAYLWQLLPQRLALRWEGAPKLAAMSVLVPAALAAVYAAGPAFESLFFAGDFKSWVNGGAGRAMPFLFLLLLPLCIVVSVAACERGFGRRLTRRMRSLRRERAALWDLARWGAVVSLSLSLSLLLASLLESLGVDARGGLVDTYVQRNTLVVGFAMGFAVIPIIYTLAEDALNAAPEHLRAASLGCGGTPWQTALYVILPTAVSGVFSAVMIGMGRAVGETMIVVMSAGNTPIMDWNVFNGLRALSATIAVELPEAVKDGTLYRVLFLAGLVLFAMTFLINTAAEMVRQHFRKRTSQL